MAGGGAQVTSCQVNPRPICTGAISPPKVHLHKPRGVQRHKGRWKPKVLRRKDTLSGPPPRAVPGEELPDGGQGESWPSWSRAVGE